MINARFDRTAPAFIPPMSLVMRDWTSPVRLRVKKAIDWRCKWLNMRVRSSCMTCWRTFVLAVATGGLPDEVAATARQRRPEADPAALIADGWASARRMIEEYVAAGLSKFVVRPATASDTPGALEEFLDRFAAEMLPLQN